MTYKQEDMPMTEDGIVPDIIVNPNGIPKRMSIGQLIECAFSKVGALKGLQLDGTPYRKTEVTDIIPVLENLGFKGSGSEVLYNGKTGEQLTSDIFIGPTFYYRLKHLVQDKIHCLDYQTEILTKEGWKKHNELTMEDKIATLKDDKLVYEKPLHIYDYPDHVGNIYNIKNQSIDLKVTDGHRNWVSNDNINYDFVYAKDIIGKTMYYKKDAIYEEENLVEIQNKINSITNNKSNFTTNSEEIADELQQLCLHANWSATIHKENNIYNVSIQKNLEDLRPLFNHNDIIIEENIKCPVWCVNVPNEVFYVRRNGKACWTGNSRASGPYQLLTKQPAEGRSRDGGLRVGEMERDALISHGVVGFLKERMFDCSDKYYVWVDKETGMISPVNPAKKKYVSLYSNNTTQFAKVQIPHASKLLFQELMSLGIVPRIFTSSKV